MPGTMKAVLIPAGALVPLHSCLWCSVFRAFHGAWYGTEPWADCCGAGQSSCLSKPGQEQACGKSLCECTAPRGACSVILKMGKAPAWDAGDLMSIPGSATGVTGDLEPIPSPLCFPFLYLDCWLLGQGLSLTIYMLRT